MVIDSSDPVFAARVQRLVARSTVDVGTRLQLLADPEMALEREGLRLPEGQRVHVVQSSSDEFVMVLAPMLDVVGEGDELDEDSLADMAGGVTPTVILGMIGGGIAAASLGDDVPRGRKRRDS